LADKVDAHDSVINKQLETKIHEEIGAVKQKYDDFDAILPKMTEVGKTIRGLNVEELYQVTKLREGQKVVSNTKPAGNTPQSDKPGLGARVSGGPVTTDVVTNGDTRGKRIDADSIIMRSLNRVREQGRVSFAQ
jgi:hypothetical protein